jgi:hypothetical protein
VSPPGEVSSHRGQVHSLLSAAKRGEAVRNPSGGGTIRQDFQCHLQAFEIVRGD